MSSEGSFFVRWRVRFGYLIAVVVLWLARPNPRSILYGTAIGTAGLFLRAWAAGYLHKQEVLTVTGPYAYTRNPLYLGSAILTLAAAMAAHSWPCAAVLGVYFVLFYSVVMRREEAELRKQHGPAFDEYARTVPLFFPRLTPKKQAPASVRSFSFVQYKKNHEYQATIGFLLLLAVLFLIWRLRLH